MYADLFSLFDHEQLRQKAHAVQLIQQASQQVRQEGQKT
jgi:hypothetical protein